MTEHVQDTETIEQESKKPVSLPGHRLRLTRENLHLSKDEVAHHLHLDVQIVEALESDEYSSLPSPAYICGYLRSYARILKLPEDEIVNAYSKGHAINAALIPESVNMRLEKRINPVIIKSIIAILLVVLISAGFMWIADKFHMFSKTPNVQQNADSIVIPEPVPQTVIERPEAIQEQIQQFNTESVETEQPVDRQVADTPLRIDETESTVDVKTVTSPVNKGDLRLVVNEDSWIEVMDSNKQRHVYRLAEKGSEIFVAGIPPYTVLLGNADGVEVYYKDKPFNHKRYQRDQIAYFRIGTTEEQ